MMYIVMDENQDWCFTNFDEARNKAIELGYNTLKSSTGDKYYF